MAKNGNGANLGFEDKLWEAADKLRGHMDASQYKHVVLGLIFLKYISDSFEERRKELAEMEYADPEDRDEYLMENIFWVPPEARWENLQAKARSPEIGKVVDDAMAAIEQENPQLKGVLPKRYARPDLDKRKLGELIDLIAGIGLGSQHNGSEDVLGRVYEYFLGKFAAKEGKSGGEFYTPESIVKLLVEMIEPYEGRIYDPCCGSGGMFVQSEKFVEEHGGNLGDLSIYGQESNPTTWKLCKMNLAIRGIESNLGGNHADSFLNDQHPDLKADYILANPPFNLKDWGQEHLQDDARWEYGVPPANNANYAWIQHIVQHLAPDGLAGFVMSNGSMTSTVGAEKRIRAGLIKDDLVDCVVALPPQLFYTTQIPVCLWFLRREKNPPTGTRRTGELLFIDATDLGKLVDRTHREFREREIAQVASTYHAWRGQSESGYEDQIGFCKSVGSDTVEGHDFVLTPGRYVGTKIHRKSDEEFRSRLLRLSSELEEQVSEAQELNNKIMQSLAGLNGLGE